ncbi:MAG TPA: PAS domain S-box protein [bacterium]|nr:PAS domain S-box protein [bacterium]
MGTTPTTEELLSKIAELEYENKVLREKFQHSKNIAEQKANQELSIQDLNRESHACHIYKNEEEFSHILSKIVTSSTNNSTKLVIITNQQEKIKTVLSDNHTDLVNLIESGRLDFISNPRPYFQNNKNISLTENLFNQKDKDSHSEQFDNTMVLFSLNWETFHPDSILEHEARMNYQIPENCSYICQYNKNQIPASLLKGLLKTHPIIIDGTHIKRNLYYLPPEDFLSEKRETREVNQWMDTIEEQGHKDHSQPLDIKYKQLFKNDNDAVFIHDLQGKIYEVNKKACDLTGRSRSDLIDSNIKNMVCSIENEEADRALKKIEKQGHIRMETELNYSGRGSFPVEVSARLINGSTNLVQGIVRDITDRKKTEYKLKSSEKKYRQLIETTGDIIFKHDVQGKITFINKAGLKFSGYTREEALGKDLTDFLPPDEIQGLIERKEKRIEGDDDHYQFETRLINKDGEKIDVDVHATPIIENGSYQGSLVVARDITERKQVQREKKELQHQRQQTQKLETLGTLAGGIGHDFNNILTPILGYSEMIKQNFDNNDPNHQYINEIINGCIRAKDLIYQMLSFSRETSHERRPLNIIPIIKETLKLIRSSLPRTINIKQNYESPCPIISADPTRIHQVVMNLCTNAYQAMENQGGVLSIEVKKLYVDENTSRKYIDLDTGDYIKLSISDTGVGMDESTLQHIFEPFFTTKDEGTGMGLAVVHGIVKSHDGRISVYSDSGEGTTFNLYYPVIEDQQSHDHDSDFKIEQGNETILLVDDRENVSSIISQMLNQLGYHVIIANSSKNAVEICQQHPNKFDIAITDYIMPGMSGIQLSHKLREINPDLPIIMISGHGYNIDNKKLKKAGIQTLVHKPIMSQKIAKTIREILDK